jgi:cytidyltransferase-like protein
MTLQKEKMVNRGMVFGVFDNFHKGHESFLTQAQEKCNELVVVVTQTEVVEFIKKRTPKHSFEDRMTSIKFFDPHIMIAPGDIVMGSWSVLKEHAPDMVFLGYDQHGIALELKKMNMPFTFLKSFEPQKYKSSLMKS